ncbi:MAG: hypothetical protein MZV64_62585 [Ignavibacteriales bacterium]|nr:hypothetical protein [Ignavibacteriales bacterium]
MNISYAGNNWGGANDVCNFVESGTMSIAWTGDVSPCWPLMHTHTSYLHGKPRLSKSTLLAMCGNRSLRKSVAGSGIPCLSGASAQFWLCPLHLLRRLRPFRNQRRRLPR